MFIEIYRCEVLFQSQNRPLGEVNGPAFTFLKSFSHDLLISMVFSTCGSPFFPSTIDKEDKDRQGYEFIFSLLLMT